MKRGTPRSVPPAAGRPLRTGRLPCASGSGVTVCDCITAVSNGSGCGPPASGVCGTPGAKAALGAKGPGPPLAQRIAATLRLAGGLLGGSHIAQVHVLFAIRLDPGVVAAYRHCP